MATTKKTTNHPCGAGDCTFSVPVPPDHQVPCQTGGNDCFSARLLEAKPSIFFDQTVADVTAQINKILAGVPKDPKGGKLSFLHTPYGIMLAWVRHGGKVGPNDIPATAAPKTLKKALGLKGV